MWSPGNVTFHPMRDYAEWKNNLPIAADFVGAGFYSARCNPYFETDIRRAPTKAELLWEKGGTAEEAMLFL